MKARVPLGRMRGVAMLELAFLLIPLLLLTIGTIEVGRAVYYYNTLLKSTREAARYLSMQQRGDGEAVARCLAVYGQATALVGGTPACPAGSGQPVVPGLAVDTDRIRITYNPASGTGAGSINMVTVTIHAYPFNSPIFPFFQDSDASPLVFGDIRCTMRQAAS